MSYTRILVRRGTAATWTSSNPILAAGEFGFETDTGKFKIGNGSSNWSALQYFVTLDAIRTNIVDSAPTALDTLNELAAALNDDASFATTVTNSIASKAPLNSPSFTGTVDFSDATVSGVMLPINWTGTYSTGTTYAANDMVEYNGSVYYANGSDLVGQIPPAGSWELFASKGDTGATGPIGPAGPTGATGDTGPLGPTGATGPIGITWRGQAQAGIQYYVNDVVYYDTAITKSSYICIESHTMQYVSDILSNNKWQILAQGFLGPTGPTGMQGVTGQPGVDGATGPTGPTGPTGATGGFSSTQSIVSMTGDYYTVTTSDVGKLLTNPYIMEVWIETSSNIPVGAQIDFIQTGGEDITFVPKSGVTLYSKGGNRTISSRYAPASLKCIATNTYVLVGDLTV